MSGSRDVEALLADAAGGNASLDEAISAVVGSEVIVLLTERPATAAGAGALPMTLTDAEGRVVVPVFTSEGRVPGEAGAAPRLRAPLRALLSGWPAGVGLVLNPSDEAIVVPAEGIPALTGSAGPAAVDEAPAGLHVALGHPAEEPRELLGRFVAAAAGRPEARALYRAQAVWRGREEEPALLVGVLVEGAPDPDGVAAAISQSVGPTSERFDLFAFTSAEMSTDPLVERLVALGPWWARDTAPA